MVKLTDWIMAVNIVYCGIIKDIQFKYLRNYCKECLKILHIFNARKRSLGKGNVFYTCVILLIWGRGVGFSACTICHMTGLTPGGGSTSRRGVCLQEGGLPPGGLHPRGLGRPPTSTTVNRWAVNPTGMHTCLYINYAMLFHYLTHVKCSNFHSFHNFYMLFKWAVNCW